MSEIKIRESGCDDDGERGERGKRGHRGPTGPTGPTGPSSRIAEAVVGLGPAFDANVGFSPIIGHPGVGQYVLTLTPALPLTAVVAVLATLASANGGQVSYAGNIALSQITILTFNPAGVPTDLFFSVAVDRLV